MIADILDKIKLHLKILLAYFLVAEIPSILGPFLQNPVVTFLIEISFFVASLYLWTKLLVDWFTDNKASSNGSASLNAVLWKTIKWALLTVGLAFIPMVVFGVGMVAIVGSESVLGWALVFILSLWFANYVGLRLFPSVGLLIQNNDDRKIWSGWAQTKQTHLHAFKLSGLITLIVVPAMSLAIYVNGGMQNFGDQNWEPIYSLDMFIVNALSVIVLTPVYLEYLYRFYGYLNLKGSEGSTPF
jgi:hypothetical protein